MENDWEMSERERERSCEFSLENGKGGERSTQRKPDKERPSQVRGLLLRDTTTRCSVFLFVKVIFSNGIGLGAVIVNIWRKLEASLAYVERGGGPSAKVGGIHSRTLSRSVFTLLILALTNFSYSVEF